MRQSKFCNCHSPSNKEILRVGINHSFCKKCGCIILKDVEKNIFYTIKSKPNRLPYDLSPITVIRNMKNKTEENYPFIYQEYNINKADTYIKEKSLKSINLYLRHRKMLLLKLQKLVKAFDYCDVVFYQSLFYLDTYLSHHINEDISEKKLLYYLIGYFLCSVKLKENDVFEPPLDSFYDLSKGIFLFPERIAHYEVRCLKSINYNIFSYSAYDWLTQLISNGIVFNCEIKNPNELIIVHGHHHSLINTINKYAINILLNLTSKSLFFKYSPMYLAFSIIQIAREKYIEQNMINEKLFFDLINLYGVNPNDYKKCYEEIKDEINSEKIISSEDKEIKNENDIYKKDSKEDLKIIETKDNSNIIINKDKDIYLPNKFKSNNALLYIKDDLLINNNNLKEENKDENDIKLSLFENSPRSKNKIKSNKSIRPNKRFAIDCKVDTFKSNDNLPLVNQNSRNRYSTISINDNKLESTHTKNYSYSKNKEKALMKDLKHVRPNLQRFNSIEHKKITINNNANNSTTEKTNDKKNAKKKSKFYNSNKNLEFNNFEIESAKKNKLTSKKLPKIPGLEDIKIDIIQNNNDELNIIKNNNKNKKHYKLKANINNFEIKTSLPEETSEIKNRIY